MPFISEHCKAIAGVLLYIAFLFPLNRYFAVRQCILLFSYPLEIHLFHAICIKLVLRHKRRMRNNGSSRYELEALKMDFHAALTITRLIILFFISIFNPSLHYNPRIPNETTAPIFTIFSSFVYSCYFRNTSPHYRKETNSCSFVALKTIFFIICSEYNWQCLFIFWIPCTS